MADHTAPEPPTTSPSPNATPAEAGPVDRARLDVVIVGGSAAGLSAALALGRSRRSVLVVDAGTPRNGPSPHMHGVLGHDGVAPSEFLNLARRDVGRYDVTILEGTAMEVARPDEDTFEIGLADGRILRARRLLVASGLTDELPDIAGLRPRWGIDAVHCPYCHGWEVQDRAIAVISSGPMGVHAALLFRQWSPDVTLLVHTGHSPTTEEAVKLAACGVRVVDGPVAEVVVDEDHIAGVRMESGHVVPAQAIVVTPRMVAHSPLLESLGLTPKPHPFGAEVGLAYEASPTGQTEIAGVWAAGNMVDITGAVASAVAAGYLAGAMLNADLIDEDTMRAVHAATQGA